MDFADALGIAENRGEFMQEVVPGEAAAKAGLGRGCCADRGWQRSNPRADIVLPDRQYRTGHTVPLGIVRDGNRRTTSM